MSQDKNELIKQRVAIMESMGAVRSMMTEEEAEPRGLIAGEWIGTDGRGWLVDSLGDMDDSHWKYTLRDLRYSIERHNSKPTL
jgi:hypothetical protein